MGLNATPRTLGLNPQALEQHPAHTQISKHVLKEEQTDEWDYSLDQWFSSKVILPLEDFWQCLETFLFVIAVGRGC